ncbi:MAG: cysteine hydrolase [Lysobacteraceae bacterium]|nr:MAG: cysteine hydrolase [Xanthomonadaceae bacterium]
MRHRSAARSRSRRSALLIIDMINRFDFPGGRDLARHAQAIAANVLRLREAHARKGWPVVYCNDNFGRWRSDFRTVVDACARSGDGAEVVGLLRPGAGDYFILKPKHSAFYATALDLLLRSLRVRRVVLCGIAGDSCVHATALDAHVRDYEVEIASDATASITTVRNRRSLATLAAAGVARVATAATLVRR